MKNLNKLKGGKGDRLDPKKVDQHELKLGIKHEMEHTDDREIAQEIALDHLSEDPKYYTNLIKHGIKERKNKLTLENCLKNKKIS